MVKVGKKDSDLNQTASVPSETLNRPHWPLLSGVKRAKAIIKCGFVLFYQLGGKIVLVANTKATKGQFLEFMRVSGVITAHDLIGKFGYSYSYACKKLSLLKRQGLVDDMGNTPLTHRGQWCLTNKGLTKLRFLQHREKEQNAVIKQEERLEKEEVIKLKKRVKELEELVKIFTGPGGLDGEVARLLREYEGLVTAYGRSPKLGVRPEQLDFRQLTSCLEKLLKYSELLPAEERRNLLRKLGL